MFYHFRRNGADCGEYATAARAHVDSVRALLDSARVRSAFASAGGALLATVLRVQQDMARTPASSEGQSGKAPDRNRSVPHAFFLSPHSRARNTDEKPLDMAFYDLLGLPATATQEEIKKAYRRLAIKFHPDKNPNDPSAGETFREIAIAYTTLSDPGLRHSYNEFGKGKGDGQSEVTHSLLQLPFCAHSSITYNQEAMVDPEAIFSQLFGGERFLVRRGIPD